MKNAYYAVKTKKSKNIYTSLVDYLKHTKGVKGVVSKKFKDRKSAEDFLGLTSETKNENTQSKTESKTDNYKTDYAYVDGSYNKKLGVYGFACILNIKNKEYIIKTSESDPRFERYKNIAGELLSVLAALEKAKDLTDDIIIYYDYIGIEEYANGNWTPQDELSRLYIRAIEHYSKFMRIRFHHVKAHSGEPNNEKVDKLAKEAVGL